MPQENKPVEIIDFNTNRAEGALKDKMIQDCTEQEIKDKLTLIYSMVGLRVQHYPSGQEKQDLHDYLQMKYGKKTLSELVLAFDLAINNELDLKADDVKVYDQFTIAYLASVMSSYKIWLYNIHKNKKPVKDFNQMVEDKKILSDEEKAEWMMDWKQNVDNINFELIPLQFYDFMEQGDLLKLTSKQKWEYTTKSTTQIKTQLFNDIGICKTNDAYIAFNKFENMEKDGFTGEIKGRILNRAKRLIIYRHERLTSGLAILPFSFSIGLDIVTSPFVLF